MNYPHSQSWPLFPQMIEHIYIGGHIRFMPTCPAVPRERVKRNASVPYSLIVSKGSMTFPKVLDILRP